MAKVFKKINAKVIFLSRQSKYLTPRLKRLLCKSLIQPHFDYSCTLWFPPLNRNLKTSFRQHKTNIYVDAWIYHLALKLVRFIFEKLNISQSLKE